MTTITNRIMLAVCFVFVTLPLAIVMILFIGLPELVHNIHETINHKEETK